MTDYRRKEPKLDRGRTSSAGPRRTASDSPSDPGYSPGYSPGYPNDGHQEHGYAEEPQAAYGHGWPDQPKPPVDDDWSGGRTGEPYEAGYGGDFIDDADDDDDGPWAEPPDDSAAGYRPLRIVVIGFVVLIGGGAFWWFSDDRTVGGLPEQAPLITADNAAFKERPTDAGGLEVPHQDRQILQTLGGRHAPENVESLLPGPEDPVPLAGSEDSAEGLPIIPEAPESGEIDPFQITQIPDLSDQQPGSSGTVDGAGDGAGDGAVGFDGREDQIAALIEQMGILDDDQQIPETPLDPEATPDRTSAEEDDDDISTEPGNGEETGQSGAEEPENGEGAAPIEPASDGGYRVQLGSVDSTDAAQSEWSRLSGRHDDLLGRLTLSVQEADISGRAWYRVQAGPLTRESAEQVCAELQARNAGCMVVGR